MTPDLTVVLIGDTKAVEVGATNILLSQEEQPKADNLTLFAPGLYDLCGRHISVINMLGRQNTDHIERVMQEKQIHAILLFLPVSQHIEGFQTGTEQLQKYIIGDKSNAIAMTVFTYQDDQSSSGAFNDLRSNVNLKHIEKYENRHHLCKKTMDDPSEILSLLEKIDIMIANNEPCLHTGQMYKEDCREKISVTLQTETESAERMQAKETAESGW